MLTPSKYWRIAATLESMSEPPDETIALPDNIARATAPPTVGHALLLADYCESETTGQFRHLGIVTAVGARSVKVDWRAVDASIWVDTGTGRGFWKQPGGFAFAKTKVAGYGLHHLFAENFDGLVAREALPAGQIAVAAKPRKMPLLASSPRTPAPHSERLNPMTVIGEPNDSPRGGYVYVLKSAYGFKVGRARRMPERMKTFAVRLPFLYTIPLCAWFDDHIEAESAYHRLFRRKHINGEWFDLTDNDVDLVRTRTFGQAV